jgi:hypothetical protein
MFSLFSEKEWAKAHTLVFSQSALLDDSYTAVRKRIVRIILQDVSFWQQDQKGFILPAWSCLDDALRVGQLRYDCHRGLETFEYVEALSKTPRHTDACRVAPSNTSQQFPRMLWSGSSKNHVPIARLHPVRQTEQQRKKDSYNAIKKMIDTEIKPMFAQMLQADFGEDLKRHINVDAFSSEGDVMHQLVDCVVMGPFSSAELNANVHIPNLPTLPVPVYHRGNPLSRDFTSWGQTGGSEPRKKLMKYVLQHVNEHAESNLVLSVQDHVKMLAKFFFEESNFLCLCPKGSASIDCCIYSKRENIVFGLNNLNLQQQQETWDIRNNIVKDTFKRISEEGLLQTLWSEKIGDPVQLTEEQISETVAAHLFTTSTTVPVHTYETENSLKVLNNVSLWEWCKSRITGMYATMPLTSANMNKNADRAADASVPHVASTDYEYSADIDEDTAPSRDHHDARQHSMELLIDKLVRSAYEHAPHFWSHAHRYVASDSVWCEKSTAGEDVQEDVLEDVQENVYATFSESLYQETLQKINISAPDINNLMFPADVLHRCPCAWGVSGLCILPEEVCVLGRAALGSISTEDSLLANGISKITAWETLCAAPFKAAADIVNLLQMLKVLPSTALRTCSAREVSIVWGLLAPQDYTAWYTGEQGNWSVSAQHLATTGPGGLRIGMLAAKATNMQEYMRLFRLGETLDDMVTCVTNTQ